MAAPIPGDDVRPPIENDDVYKPAYMTEDKDGNKIYTQKIDKTLKDNFALWTYMAPTFCSWLSDDPLVSDMAQGIENFCSAKLAQWMTGKINASTVRTDCESKLKQAADAISSQNTQNVAGTSRNAGDAASGFGSATGTTSTDGSGFAVNVANIFMLMSTGTAKNQLRAGKGWNLLARKGLPFLPIALMRGQINQATGQALMSMALSGLRSPFGAVQNFDKTFDIRIQSKSPPLRGMTVGPTQLKSAQGVEINLNDMLQNSMDMYQIDKQMKSGYWQCKGFRFMVTVITTPLHIDESTEKVTTIPITSESGDLVREPNEGWRCLLVNGHPNIQQGLQQILPDTQDRDKKRWWVLDNAMTQPSSIFYQATNPVQQPRIVVDYHSSFSEGHCIGISSQSPFYFARNPVLYCMQQGPSPITGEITSTTNGEGLHMLVMTNVPATTQMCQVQIEGWMKICPAPFFGEVLSQDILDKHLMTRIPVQVVKETKSAFSAAFQPDRAKITSSAGLFGMGKGGGSYAIKRKKKSKTHKKKGAKKKKSKKSVGLISGIFGTSKKKRIGKKKKAKKIKRSCIRKVKSALKKGLRKLLVKGRPRDKRTGKFLSKKRSR